MANNANSGKAATVGFCLMFILAGIYSLFHDQLHIVSPRHGFALSEPYKNAASIGLICLGSGILVAMASRGASERNDLIGLVRVIAIIISVVGALTTLLFLLAHYLTVWFA